MRIMTRALASLVTAALVAGCGVPGEEAQSRPDTTQVVAAAEAAPAPVPQLPHDTSEPVAKADPGPAVAGPRHAPDAAPDAAPAAPAAPSPVRADSAATAGPRRIVLHGVDLTGVGYDEGRPEAPVVLVNFSDFGCPYCAKFSSETYPEIERDYVRTGKVLFKYVPFVMGMFPNGQQAAKASECAAEQGKFWAMHDRMYARQREWKATRAPYALFQKDAKAIGLDAGAFDACYARQELHPRTRQANVAAEALGVRVTPSFLVNTRGIEGALPLAEFRKVLDAAIAEAGQGR